MISSSVTLSDQLKANQNKTCDFWIIFRSLEHRQRASEDPRHQRQRSWQQWQHPTSSCCNQGYHLMIIDQRLELFFSFFIYFVKATWIWWQHWLQHLEQTLLSRTMLATPRFILLQKRVIFDDHLKVMFCNILLKEKLKWQANWSQHLEQTSLSRTMLERQQSSSPGIVSTRQILQHLQQIL